MSVDGPHAVIESDPPSRRATAFVVGGSGGIGAAIVEGFARAGVNVAVGFRSNELAAHNAVKAAQELAVEAIAVQLDLNDTKGVRSAVERVNGHFGSLDSMVFAAGSAIAQPYVSQVDEADWVGVMEADANGFFRVVSAALPALRESSGSIVLVSSAGLGRHPQGDVLSVAPKAAAEALVRAVAREEGRYGVRANIVRVGIVEGGMFSDLLASGELSDAYLDAALSNIALRSFGSPNDVAAAVVFLASPGSAYITGQALAVDGGFSV